MAVITKTALTPGKTILAPTTLTASDSLVYAAGKGEVLFLHNPTGGALTATLDGDAAAPFNVAGYGTVDPSAGFAVAVAAGQRVAVPLDSIAAFLAGTVAVTGGTGLVASILTF